MVAVPSGEPFPTRPWWCRSATFRVPFMLRQRGTGSGTPGPDGGGVFYRSKGEQIQPTANGQANQGMSKAVRGYVDCKLFKRCLRGGFHSSRRPVVHI